MYLLVEWVNENPKSWTVVPQEQIADGTLRRSKSLVGKTVGIQWKRRVHQAKVIDAGNDEQELEIKADEIAEKYLALEVTPTGSKRSKRKNSPKTTVAEPIACSSRSAVVSQKEDCVGKSGAKKRRPEQIQSVLEQLDADRNQEGAETATATNLEAETEEESSETVDLWKEKYVACKTKLRTLRTKYKALKESHSLCSQEDESEEIWAGSEVRLRRSEISALKTMSPSITFFARNLFRRVFNAEEIVGHSLLGRKSTAVENHVPLPSVDPCRRDAIIEFCLKNYGFEVSTGVGTKFLKKRKQPKLELLSPSQILCERKTQK